MVTGNGAGHAFAARLIAHGQPLDIAEVVLRPPGPNETLVAMAYGGVNPVDRYMVDGRVAPDAPLPRTLGSEGAGIAEGRHVLVHGHGLGTRRDGVWASAAVVPSDALIDVPDGVGLAEAAAMGVAGLTAWRTVTDLARVSADDRVLVLGASGGVGSMIVSLAHGIGAIVWGQTANPSKAGWIRQRGADNVVVADADGLATAVNELRPTVAFDPLGDGFTGAAISALEQWGRLVLFGTSAGVEGRVPLQQLYRKGISMLGYGGLIEPDERKAAGIRDALGAVADGRLDVAIDSVLPLARVNEALTRLGSREVRGKLVVDLASGAKQG